MLLARANLLRWGLAVLVVGGLVYGLLGRPTSRPAAQPLPNLVLETEQGQPQNLRAFVGKPVVLNTWATWCGPCRREMPLLLEEAAHQHNVQFVFVNMGEGPEAIRIFLDEVKLKQIPHLLLDKKAALSEVLQIQGLPTTLFFDAKGNLLARHLGEINREELKGYLGRLE
jgi:thiol-disulfide isomerase/thioredoxin